MPEKAYHGSCDCGQVRFEVPLDLSKGTFKCNCGICWKSRFWGAGTAADALKVTAGEAELLHYGNKIIHHFCRHCGVKLFGKSGKMTAISLAALDDATPEELAAAPVKYVDGKHDNFSQEPGFKAHL